MPGAPSSGLYQEGLEFSRRNWSRIDAGISRRCIVREALCRRMRSASNADDVYSVGDSSDDVGGEAGGWATSPAAAGAGGTCAVAGADTPCNEADADSDECVCFNFFINKNPKIDYTLPVHVPLSVYCTLLCTIQFRSTSGAPLASTVLLPIAEVLADRFSGDGDRSLLRERPAAAASSSSLCSSSFSSGVNPRVDGDADICGSVASICAEHIEKFSRAQRKKHVECFEESHCEQRTWRLVAGVFARFAFLLVVRRAVAGALSSEKVAFAFEQCCLPRAVALIRSARNQ